MSDTPNQSSPPPRRAAVDLATAELRAQIDAFSMAEAPSFVHLMMFEHAAQTHDAEHGKDDVRRCLRVLASLCGAGMPAASLMAIVSMLHTINHAAQIEAMANGTARTTGWRIPVTLVGQPEPVAGESDEDYGRRRAAATIMMIASNRVMSSEQMQELLRIGEPDFIASMKSPS